MGYYRTCPICGANLDPGETCSDCHPARTEVTPPRIVAISRIRQPEPRRALVGAAGGRVKDEI